LWKNPQSNLIIRTWLSRGFWKVRDAISATLIIFLENVEFRLQYVILTLFYSFQGVVSSIHKYFTSLKHRFWPFITLEMSLIRCEEKNNEMSDWLERQRDDHGRKTWVFMTLLWQHLMKTRCCLPFSDLLLCYGCVRLKSCTCMCTIVLYIHTQERYSNSQIYFCKRSIFTPAW
jgi:hypothetical protein